MTRTRCFDLAPDCLEERVVPALVASLFGDITLVRGIPQDELTITATAPDTIRITDTGASLDVTLPVEGDLWVQLFRRPTPDGVGRVVIDLDGNTLTGDVFLDLGRGDGNVDRTANEVIIEEGTIAGNLTILRGDGREDIQLGANAGGAPLTVGGNVTVVANPRGANATGGDLVTLAPGSTVLGSLTQTYVDQVTIGSLAIGSDLARVAGDVSIRNPGSTMLQVDVIGQVNGDVNVTGSVREDTITMFSNTTPASGTIDGSLTLNLQTGGTAGEIIDIAAEAVIGQSLTAVTTSTGFDFFSLSGNVGADLSVDLGNGENLYLFNSGSSIGGDATIRGGVGMNDLFDFSSAVGNDLSVFFDGTGFFNNITFTPDASIGGDFRFEGGDGDILLDLANLDWNGVTVRFGNGINDLLLTGDNTVNTLDVQTGNGDNLISVEIFAILGGFTFRGGNGDDAIELTTDNDGSGLNVDIRMGSGDDMLDLNGSSLNVFGVLDGGTGVNELLGEDSANLQVTIRNFV